MAGRRVTAARAALLDKLADYQMMHFACARAGRPRGMRGETNSLDIWNFA